MMVTAPVAGMLGQKLDPRLMMFVGISLFALSCIELTPITKDWSYAELFVPQALRGVGMMTAMIPVNILALGTLPPDRIKNASGLYNLMRNLGGAVGLALLLTELNNRTDVHYERLRETVTWSRDTVTERLGDMTHSLASLGSNASAAAVRQLTSMAEQQAQVMAFADVFLIIAGVFAATLFRVRGSGTAFAGWASRGGVRAICPRSPSSSSARKRWPRRFCLRRWRSEAGSPRDCPSPRPCPQNGRPRGRSQSRLPSRW